ncbi:hypothetical protein [Rhizobium phage RHph_N46]|nr:hypothetical protein [Rhizobium phage RHph_N46]
MYALFHKGSKRYLHRQRFEDEIPERGAHADFYQWRDEETGAHGVKDRTEGKTILRTLNIKPKDVSFRPL